MRIVHSHTLLPIHQITAQSSVPGPRYIRIHHATATPQTSGDFSMTVGKSREAEALSHLQHTSQAGPSACMSDIIRVYMVNGTPPEGDETVYEVDPEFELFVGVNTSTTITSLLAEDEI
ncbi:hypothetical protein C8Q74DRAFT_1433973 [Fomes fomentarius]|nr:hypothetical protein C8Q74DRAFT_1433973 [Fomes fomentarius]